MNGVDVVSNGDFYPPIIPSLKVKKYYVDGKEASAFIRNRKDAGAGSEGIDKRDNSTLLKQLLKNYESNLYYENQFNQ